MVNFLDSIIKHYYNFLNSILNYYKIIKITFNLITNFYGILLSIYQKNLVTFITNNYSIWTISLFLVINFLLYIF